LEECYVLVAFHCDILDSNVTTLRVDDSKVGAVC